MLIDDPNKHFGFLEKSRRFQLDAEDHDRHIRDHHQQISVDHYEKKDHERIASMETDNSESKYDHQRKKVESKDRKELLRLRMENERLEQNYQKQLHNMQKELNSTADKCSRLESALQSTVKEKSMLNGNTQSKEKDFQDLMHKHTSLLQKVQ